MLRVRLRPVLSVLLLGTLVLDGMPHAQQSHDPTIGAIELPVGLQPALASAQDPVTADRAQFLVEIIRRHHDNPTDPRDPQRVRLLAGIVSALDGARARQALFRPPSLARQPQNRFEEDRERVPVPTNGVRVRSSIESSVNGSAAHPSDPVSSTTVPLPLTADVWIDAVLGGRGTTQTLGGDILRSRNAALLYSGMLSLDEPTRRWLAEDRQLVRALAEHTPAAFQMIAHGLRVHDGRVVLPGGEPAVPIWEALVGRTSRNPAAFVRALVDQNAGRLGYFFGTMAHLSTKELSFAFDVTSAVPSRIETARRLLNVFERLAGTWRVEDHAFARPILDPALLITDLRTDEHGTPVLPGTTTFWKTVLAEETPAASDRNGARLTEGDAVDFAWLCEQVFRGSHVLHRSAYHVVAFASRHVREVTAANAVDAVDTLRAIGEFPALIAALERAGLTDVAVVAPVARRAAQVSRIDDETREVRALAQFQGALALITRATLRGSLSREEASQLAASLAAIDLSDKGTYDGRVIRWLDAAIVRRDSTASIRTSPGVNAPDVFAAALGPMDIAVFQLLAGPHRDAPTSVEWEGTRYRVDFTWAEATRLAALLGSDARPYLSAGATLVAVADVFDEKGLTRDRYQQAAARLQQIAEAAPWEAGIANALRRAARDSDWRAAERRAPVLRELADELVARGLMDLAYAAALGHPDRIPISARDAAGRHEFNVRGAGGGHKAAWWFPTPTVDRLRNWHVTGSLLGLDARLAEFSLRPLSSKPPLRRPTLNDADRRAFVEAAAYVQATALTDDDRDQIVAALRAGRTRLAAARTPNDASTIADAVHLSPMRRTLLAWTVEHDRPRVAAFLSPTELFRLGSDGGRTTAALDAWGANAEPRLGCLCLRFPDPRAHDMAAGRWDAGLLAAGFADLNVRLAELLSELRMPAALVAPVLAAATLDFINSATSRDRDDYRGLIEFVQSLRVDRVEQYLALLTTDGPLVPE